MSREEKRAAIKSLSPTMRKALRKLITQGRSDDLCTNTIRRDTIQALRVRGFVAFNGVRRVLVHSGLTYDSKQYWAMNFVQEQ